MLIPGVPRSLSRPPPQSTAVAIETSATTRLTGDWGAACEFIARKEFDLVSLQNERVKLSPRAIEEGWSAQLDADVRQNRAWVTEGKERALFEVSSGDGAREVCGDVHC